MMTSYFEYIVTSLDMHSIDLEDFKFGGTNITAFRIVDPHNPEVVEVLNILPHAFQNEAEMF